MKSHFEPCLFIGVYYRQSFINPTAKVLNTLRVGYLFESMREANKKTA